MSERLKMCIFKSSKKSKPASRTQLKKAMKVLWTKRVFGNEATANRRREQQLPQSFGAEWK